MMIKLKKSMTIKYKDDDSQMCVHYTGNRICLVTDNNLTDGGIVQTLFCLEKEDALTLIKSLSRMIKTESREE